MAYPDRTPRINATGAYELRSPFTIDSGIEYRCEAIEGFEKLEEQGINPFSEYYQPNGLLMSDYQDDKNNGINIITLMSENGATIHVPSSYIISYPTDTSVPYSNIVLSVDLGSLPEQRDLLDLQMLVKQAAEQVTGNTVTVNIHKRPIRGFVSYTESQQLEASREANKDDLVSELAGKISAEEELSKARSQISAMSTIIDNLQNA